MARLNIPAILLTAVVYIFLIAGRTHCKPWTNRRLLVADYEGDGSTNVRNPGAPVNVITGGSFIIHNDDGVNKGEVLCNDLLIEKFSERVPCKDNNVLVTWISIDDDKEIAHIRVEKSLDRIAHS